MPRESLEKIPKEDKEEMQGSERTIKSLINEAGNNFTALSWHRNNSIEKIRKIIMEMSDVYLKNLEDFTGRNQVELEKVKKGICYKYNDLMEKLKNSNLEYEDFIRIVEEGKEITSLK